MHSSATRTDIGKSSPAEEPEADVFGVEQPTYWSAVPEWVTFHSELSDGCKVCYAALARYANSDRKLWPSQQSVADRLGKSIRAIRGYIAELVTAGALTELERPFDSPVRYRLEIDSPERREALRVGLQKSRSETPAKSCHSVEKPLPGRGGDRQESAGGTGKNLPPNQSHEPETYKSSITSNARGAGSVETPPMVKDRALKAGYGCRPCDTTGNIEQDDGCYDQCRSCGGSGVDMSPRLAAVQ